MKKAISVTSSPPPVGPYSQAIVTDDLVFVAGQGPMNPATKSLPEAIEGQTHQALCNIRSILAASGGSMDDVVKATVHLADLASFAAFNRVYAEYFHKPYPARTTVGSRLDGILVEIDVIAIRHRRESSRPARAGATEAE